MKTSELHYELPPELIADAPADRRDASRLLVLDRVTGGIRHEVFHRLPELLPPGALLVLNDTKVLPARLRMHRRTGGCIQGLFLREPEPGVWEMMLTSGRRLKPGELLSLDGEQQIRLLGRVVEGTWRVEPVPGGLVEQILAKHGSAPLPPYIHRQQASVETPPNCDGDFGARSASEGVPQASTEQSSLACASGPEACRKEVEPIETGTQLAKDRARDLERYQTVYARRPGAVAAPTAGLHFTPELMARLNAAGFATAFVTLHVGAGTFAPIRVDDLAQHPMHVEHYECPPATAEAVNAARAAGKPVVAVGTTSVRVLETCADERGCVIPGNGSTRIFIYPPYRYRVVDRLITNFHLPESTLLALVFALAGRELVLHAYEEAIRERYRFYSYGDAMLIL